MGQALQLKQLMQNAPVQSQILQQQQQSGALQVQQQQQQLTDQKAMTAGMQQWDGKDYNDLPGLVMKNGGSATAVFGLKQKINEQLLQQSTTLKNNGDAAVAQATAAQKKGDSIAGALLPLTDPKQTPDAQLPQALQASVQDLTQRGLLDPQHAAAAQQLLQTSGGDPTAIRNGIDQFRKTFMAQSQIMDDAMKQAGITRDVAQTGEANANTARINTEMASGGTQAMADAKFRNLTQQKLEGQPISAADQAWMGGYKQQKELVPAFTFNQQMAGGAGSSGNPNFQQPGGGGADWGKVAGKYGLTQGAFDQQAEKYFQTGQLPPIGRGSASVIAQNRDLMNRAADLHPGESLAETSSAFKANSSSLKNLQGSLDTVTAFENTANANINMLKGIAAKVPDLGVKFANTAVRDLSASMIGGENIAALHTALAPVQAESAKILNSANLQGQLSDSSRHELQDIIDGNLPYKSLVASLNVLQQDFKNRHDSTAQQIQDIQTRLRGGAAAPGGAGGSTQQPGAGAPMKITLPSGKQVTIE
jgi:hypothetical protein